MSQGSLSSKPNVALAVDRLRALIFSGDLPSGSNHLEGELAARLGMSRTPVREALMVLASQGLIEVRPRHGIRILPVSATDMAEIYDVLTELESLAAARAACRGLEANDLAGMAQAIEDMDAALTADDRKAWAAADDQFHAELVRLGDNSRVSAIVGMMVDQVRRARIVTLFMRPAPTGSNDDHRAVYQAILRGDAGAAKALHHEHRTRSKAMLLDLLRKHQLKAL